jgi:hypothetical protein
MTVTPVKNHKGWKKVTDDNKKEHYMYAFEFPSGKISRIIISPKILWEKPPNFKYNVLQSLKTRKKYCGGSDSLDIAIQLANQKRAEVRETGERVKQ